MRLYNSAAYSRSEREASSFSQSLKSAGTEAEEVRSTGKGSVFLSCGMSVRSEERMGSCF